MKFSLMVANFLKLAPFLFVFIASLYRPWDSDLGWHLKYGEYFFQNWSLLRENIYSTEMAGYFWPNTNWLTDVLTYAIFYAGGFFGLSVAAALIITLTFWVFSKAFDLDYYQKALIFPALVILETPVHLISFRGQLLSILFLGLLFLFLEKLPERKKMVFIPLLFIVWVNTHGQFILGLGILGIYLGFKLVEKVMSYKRSLPALQIELGVMSFRFTETLKSEKNLILTFILSVLAGVMNPFGIETYKIALSHFNSPELSFILEYLPVEDLTEDWWKQMVYGIGLFFGVLGIIFTGKIKENITSIGIISIFYVLAFMVRRYAWSMYYLGIPLLKPVADFLKPDLEKNALRAGVVLFVFYIGFVVYLKLPLEQFSRMNWEVYCQEFNKCSEGATLYVEDNGLGGNMMSMYNWGGYIIWNHPRLKPSIDGRMTVWKDANGASPLSAYYAYETNSEDIDYSKYDVVLMGSDKEVYGRLEELVEEGRWEKRYEDALGGVFVRKVK